MVKRKTVLVADNDAGVSRVLSAVLERVGLGVECCADGAEAWDRVTRGGIELLICDLDMPKMSGEELIDALDQRADAPPIVVISGFVDPAQCEALSRRRHVRSVLRKPFDVMAFGELARELTGCVDERGEVADGA